MIIFTLKDKTYDFNCFCYKFNNSEISNLVQRLSVNNVTLIEKNQLECLYLIS